MPVYSYTKTVVTTEEVYAEDKNHQPNAKT